MNLRKATLSDLDAIKRLYSQNSRELGFVLRPSLIKSIDLQEIILAEDINLVGAVHYHHRRDKQTTLYHIAVASEQRRQRVGWHLINALLADCRQLQMQKILLKCPEELAANVFYEAVGFKLSGVETGKRRRLNVWTYELGECLTL